MVLLWINIVHVISASVLLGAGVGTAFYVFYVNQQNNVALIARVTKQAIFVNWIFIGSSGVIQFITGMILLASKGYSPFALWVMGSMIGYVIAALCWLLVLYFQMRCRDLAFEAVAKKKLLSIEYNRYYHASWIWGMLALVSLMVVFYLMVNRPG
ncbi:MAG: DUF2269 domain-containing protein [Gammaproteobacteria bacterium CG_4_10_14_0_8_um_filter_38_16]|nr:MAG: DUF2269 domain-containing protein [Gammaproteobacteria bacterium CG_4_10_14_0_8_um_filter_38_16]PJA04332.1 MAG: DUF2269 domain-containing protein [Gammaproteobacteria bacterium CG_4_10_14_0_2_um_filter_38_22]PJB10086.1 MAG: DUF2269 domain-containing protein [Gammaproteobacteria bacterium CG_4_9_14_3_um_filter_38_9]